MWAPVASEPTSHLSAVLDVIDKTTKILALIVAAGWGYLNYLRGRTFKHRLEPTISGKMIRNKSGLLLSGIAQVKNVGLSQVPIEQRGTAIELLSYAVSNDKAEAPTLVNQIVTVLSVFEAHGWIEPGEPVEDSFLIPLREGPETVAFRLRLRIVSGGIEWNADSIVEIARPNPEAGDSHSAYAVTVQDIKADQQGAEIKNNMHSSKP
jgi:hypothetical protein